MSEVPQRVAERKVTGEAEPMVSVCMTTYNHEKYLAQAIECVLNQHCSFAVEIRLGVDRSSDATEAIAAEYARRFGDCVKLEMVEQRLGMRRNYARTIAACRGKYVAFCDGDDWWCDQQKLQRQVELLEQNPDIAMCFTRSKRVSDDGTVVSIYPPADGRCSFEEMLELNRAENCTAVARRSDIEEYYRTVEPLSHTEWLTDDLPMWLWFAANRKIAFIDEVTAAHRIVEQSVSHRSDYHERIAFCDSLGDIKLWADKAFNGGRRRFALLKRRENDALWALARYGTAAEYMKRWWQGVMAHPSLVANVAGYVLIFKRLKRK